MPIKMSGSKHILWIGAALLVAGCTVKDSFPDTLSGEGKTPLLIEASIHDGHEMTKAINGSFSDGDEFWGYLRHTTGGSKGGYTVLNHANATNPTKQIRVKRYSGVWTSVELNYSTSSSPLYWDDFSNSAVSETDMRTAGHGLQSYYAYCYNGGTPSTALDVAAGTLGWTVATNQNTDNNCRESDLLWSPEQETVAYVHGSSTNDAQHTLRIPFTHAMSEITVTVHANEGYANNSSQWSSTALTLHGMNTVASLTAPTGTVSGGTTADITMLAYSLYDNYRKCDFTAIVAPESKLKVGDKLLDITFLDGNNYEVYITSDMVPKDDDDDDSNNQAWSNNHAVNTESDKDYIHTKPGYNYHLNLTVNKAKVLVDASLTSWTEVSSSATGDIVFTNDEQSVDVSDANYENGASFSLFRYHGDTPNNSNYEYATVSTWNTPVASTWNNAPAIYWPNKNDYYYFRALAQLIGISENIKNISFVGDRNDNPVNNGTGIAQNGNDILWGTTTAHSTYSAGQYLPPRTGNVPLTFRHALSKLTINLTTPGDESAVDLTDATIAVTNLYTEGTINLHDGTVTPSSLNTESSTLASAAISNRASISNLRVIPQTIGNDAQIIITLSDAVYRLQLNQCKITSSETAIGTWEGGKDYNYTITVAKDAV